MTIDLLPMLTKASSEGMLKEIYGDLAKPGVSQVGKALSTVLGLGNTILLPIQLLNERARLAIEANLEGYRKRLAKIPIENIVGVAPEIGVPAVEKLSYVKDAELRELYTTLLEKASSIDTLDQAHPSFINIINNLSPDEARFLRQFKHTPGVPFVSLRFTDPSTGNWLGVAKIFAAVLEGTSLDFPNHLTAYLSNLEGLGLLSLLRNDPITPAEWYEVIEEHVRTEVKKYKTPPEYSKTDILRARAELTEFGRLFIKTCVVESDQPVIPTDTNLEHLPSTSLKA